MGRPIGVGSGVWFWWRAVWPLSSIKVDVFRFYALHSSMSNIIPLPFESTLSASYADASELVQAMQHLECHLAHIINIWVTSKCLLYPEHDLKLTDTCCRPVRVMAGPFGGREFSNAGVMGRLELENQVIKGMMGQLRLMRNYNNLLIKQWDPGHGNAGNGWAAAAAWEQE